MQTGCYHIRGIKLTAFWDIAPCSLIECDRRFKGTYCLHQQDDASIIALMIEAVSTSVVGYILRDYTAQYPKWLST
jgi:hypothetical protein